MSATDDSIVAALLRERESYERQGLTARVALVNEQLALRGYEVAKDDDPHKEPPRKRQAPAKRTAD